MIFPPVTQTYSPYPPGSIPPGLSDKQTRQPADDEPPKKPDWLLIMVSILFLITVLIAWFINRPDL